MAPETDGGSGGGSGGKGQLRTPEELKAYDLGHQAAQKGPVSKRARKEAIEKAGLKMDRHAEAFNAGVRAGEQKRQAEEARQIAQAQAKRLEPLTSRGQGPVTAAEITRNFQKDPKESTKAFFQRYAGSLAARLQAAKVPIIIEATGKAYTVSKSTNSVYIHGDKSNLEIRISDHSSIGGMHHDPDVPSLGMYRLRPLGDKGSADHRATRLTDKILSIVKGYGK